MFTRDFAKKAPAAAAKPSDAPNPKPPKATSTKKAAPKRAKAKSKAASASEQRNDVLASILQHSTGKADHERKVGPHEQKGLMVLQRSAPAAAPQAPAESKRTCKLR